MIKYFIKLYVFLLISIPPLFGQKIVNMNGTFDLDGDKMLEFVSLELNPKKDVFPNVVRFYEIDSDGYQNIVWEFIPPVTLEGDFVDAKIGDINGDGIPQLIIVMNFLLQ